MMIRGLLERLQRGDQSVPEVTLVLGSASVALVQSLAPAAPTATTEPVSCNY